MDSALLLGGMAACGGESAGDADDTAVAALWPDLRVGVLATGMAVPTLAVWSLQPADTSTPDALIDELEGR